MAEIRLYQRYVVREVPDEDHPGEFDEEVAYQKVFAPFDYDKFLACLKRYRGDAARAGSNAVNALLEKAISEATDNVDIAGDPLSYCHIEFLPVEE